MNYLENLEIFKPIIGYENLYKISNLGNVKSLKTNRFIKNRITKKGYIDIKLSKNNKSMRFLLHGIKNDNRIENLEWCNNIENAKHAEINNLRSHEGIKNSHAKLTEIDVKFIKYWLSKNFKIIDISKHFNVTPGQIGHIKYGRSWTHV